jgi:hypothetical protein
VPDLEGAMSLVGKNPQRGKISRLYDKQIIKIVLKPKCSFLRILCNPPLECSKRYEDRLVAIDPISRQIPLSQRWYDKGANQG